MSVATEERRVGPRCPAVRILAASGLLPGLGVLLLGVTGRDDAYITHWVAETLARTGEILNYNLERFEQSSSLLLVMLLGTGRWLTGVEVPELALIVSVLAGMAASVVAAGLARRTWPGSGPLVAALTATSGFLVYWSFSGMETPLAACAVTLWVWAAVAVLEAGWNPLRLGACAAAAFVATAVRPETALVLAAATSVTPVSIWLRAQSASGPPRDAVPARAGELVALLASATAAVVAWRLVYFGAIVPQPVDAKAGIHVGWGIDYLARTLFRPALVPFVAVAVWAAWWGWRRGTVTDHLSMLVVGAQVGFVVTAGGDWMEAGRMLVPVVPLVAVLVGAGVHEAGFGRRTRPVVALLLVAVNLAGVATLARSDGTGRPLWAEIEGPSAVIAAVAGAPMVERSNRVHIRDLALLDHLDATVDAVARTTDGPVTVASGQAGLVPYRLLGDRPPQIRFIDLGSLTTDAFDACADRLVQSPLGAGVPLRLWLDRPDACDVELPDVFYNVTAYPERLLGEHYVLVHEQPGGSLRASSGLFPGASVDAAYFVAVRADVARTCACAS